MPKPITFAAALGILILGFALAVVIVRNASFEFTSKLFNIVSREEIQKIDQTAATLGENLDSSAKLIEELASKNRNYKEAINEFSGLVYSHYQINRQVQGPDLRVKLEQIINTLEDGDGVFSEIRTFQNQQQQMQIQLQQQLQQQL